MTPARFRVPEGETPEAYHVPRMPLPMLCWRLGGNAHRVLVRVRWLPSMLETERYVPSNCLDHWHGTHEHNWDSAYARSQKKRAEEAEWLARMQVRSRDGSSSGRAADF